MVTPHMAVPCIEFCPLTAGWRILAKHQTCWHYASMLVQINIRDVPDDVRDILAERAASQGKSMQEFLRIELEKLASRPSLDGWLNRVRTRKVLSPNRITAQQILEDRDSERR